MRLTVLISLITVDISTCHNNPTSGSHTHDQHVSEDVHTVTEALSESLALFSEKFYLELSKQSNEDNFVFSPLSIHAALTLLAEGATKNSETELEIRTLLAKVGNINNNLLPYKFLSQSYANSTVAFGNHVWVSQKASLNPEFKDTVEDAGVRVDALHFGAADAVDAVNSWVNNVTRGKIPSIVKSLEPQTECLIANAMHINETWTSPFKLMPFAMKFLVADNTTRDVKLMERHDTDYKYGTVQLYDKNHQIVKIPYKDESKEMLIILPHRDIGLSKFEKFLDSQEVTESLLAKIKETKMKYTKREIRLRMPKFRLSSDLKANEILQNLGVKRVFTDESELGRLTNSTQLRVNKILHKALVQVDEEGTEAAAATIIDVVPFSASFPFTVNLDRAFMFALYDTHFDIPLIMGRVMDPTLSHV
eukprot:TRINITY_DN5766_c0_g1_i1.p1 TRINITY_DN5766_c0_g1~~TRINITY_DN5766_c0_g1_i1.p1  ORF type:complete len:434 (+),score=82.61 TRINITY_DN5766_c0_g1_i1:40-1302(+)